MRTWPTAGVAAPVCAIGTLVPQVHRPVAVSAHFAGTGQWTEGVDAIDEFVYTPELRHMCCAVPVGTRVWPSCVYMELMWNRIEPCRVSKSETLSAQSCVGRHGRSSDLRTPGCKPVTQALAVTDEEMDDGEETSINRFMIDFKTWEQRNLDNDRRRSVRLVWVAPERVDPIWAGEFPDKRPRKG